MDKELIIRLFNQNKLDESKEILSKYPNDAWALYMLGRIAWKNGDKAEAISCYTNAADIDPNSEAAVALDQTRQIMDFYNKDLYNP